jgi:hypothetical protein
MLQEWLSTLITSVGGGVFLWLIMGLLVKAIPSLDQDSNLKFWIAFVLAFIIPVLAYAAMIGLGYTAFSWEQLATVIAAGYAISQTVHRGSEQIRGVSK